MHDQDERSISDSVLTIVCVDRRLEDDLMFIHSLVQHLERKRDRQPILFVVGTGEAEERALASSGVEILREKGELLLPGDGDIGPFERAAREHLQKYVNLFTDAGIACVGFFGADRQILHTSLDGTIAVSYLDAILGNTRMGVVSVLLSTGVDTGGNLSDLHPIRVCDSIQKILSEKHQNYKGRIVILVNNSSIESLRKATDGQLSTWTDIENSGLHFDEPIRTFAQNANGPFCVSTVADLGGVS